MTQESPSLNYTDLAERQFQSLSFKLQNLVCRVVNELVAMEDHRANDNPFMEGCSLFSTYSKSLTKWGVKITYGICQDTIDIVCIEVDPSSLPPSGPQAISIRSFSANDNYEFIQHPIARINFACDGLKKVGAWISSTKYNDSVEVLERNSSYDDYSYDGCIKIGALILFRIIKNHLYRVDEYLRFSSEGEVRLYGRYAATSIGSIGSTYDLFSAMAGNYDALLWKVSPIGVSDWLSLNRNNPLASSVRTVFEFDRGLMSSQSSAVTSLDYLVHSEATFENDDLCGLDQDLLRGATLGWISTSSRDLPRHLN
ncbi:hypothetical protein ACQQ2Q_22320 [Agrobacterium sp. ES01]|uniref:hypothetical protein n=1 Tax=Agrobacterium sp. ES01 TaxID=3420714 RepID=UPI003D0A5988